MSATASGRAKGSRRGVRFVRLIAVTQSILLKPAANRRGLLPETFRVRGGGGHRCPLFCGFGGGGRSGGGGGGGWGPNWGWGPGRGCRRGLRRGCRIIRG